MGLSEDDINQMGDFYKHLNNEIEIMFTMYCKLSEEIRKKLKFVDYIEFVNYKSELIE